MEMGLYNMPHFDTTILKREFSKRELQLYLCILKDSYCKETLPRYNCITRFHNLSLQMGYYNRAISHFKMRNIIAGFTVASGLYRISAY